jgi:hypothetical protein
MKNSPAIIPASELRKLIGVAPAPKIGAPARSLRLTDLEPRINKAPQNDRECESRVMRLKKIGYLVPVDEQMNFGSEEYAPHEDDMPENEHDLFNSTIANYWG